VTFFLFPLLLFVSCKGKDRTTKRTRFVSIKRMAAPLLPIVSIVSIVSMLSILTMMCGLLFSVPFFFLFSFFVSVLRYQPFLLCGQSFSASSPTVASFSSPSRFLDTSLFSSSSSSSSLFFFFLVLFRWQCKCRI
jgi:hypothetical protein